MCKILKRYQFLIVFLLPFGLSLVAVSTSCNPYRPGATVKPVGGAGGKKYHTRTASAKARKKRKY